MPTASTPTATPRVFVRDTDLATRYGVHRATIWRWSTKGKLPPPVQLSIGTTRWSLAEVEAVEAKLAAKRITRSAS